ncbi:hypothetical protein GCM10011611_23920 [Aliidongia dinghuensis]|uniref:YjiS-like domain-containing protein n=1 Tax=Aliidongia dinghuensis TaxID=1867774 RepID=A0A8J2YUM8_9PROT|nr:DUF1127 domain-containing protein [Aliidongia dinghuensis]GGF17328.1 hypothetical protein GCM10011611_23920 [Aliidongia dinghuensis]
MSISFKSAPAVSLAPAATSGRLTQFRELVGLWVQRMRERAELAQCDERDLLDMGVSRATALAEIRKPFWRE